MDACYLLSVSCAFKVAVPTFDVVPETNTSVNRHSIPLAGLVVIPATYLLVEWAVPSKERGHRLRNLTT